MSDKIEQLMESNLLRVFNERDFDRRMVAIDDTYAPQVRWTDDEGVTVGQDASMRKRKRCLTGRWLACRSSRRDRFIRLADSAILLGMSSLPAAMSQSCPGSTWR